MGGCFSLLGASCGCEAVTSSMDTFFFLDVLLLIKKRAPSPLPKMADVSAEEKVDPR